MKSITLLAGCLLVAGFTFAQKVNVTSAAVEYKRNFQPALMSGRVDDAKEALLNAKKYIDLAAVNPETKDDEKTLYYKGEIYGAAAKIAMMTGDTSYLITNFGEDAFEVSINSLKKSYTSGKKYRADIESSVNQQIGMLSPVASKFYENKEYDKAAAAFFYIYKISTAVNAVDSVNLYNAGLCFEKAEMYKEAGEVYAELAETGYQGGKSYAYAGAAFSKANEHEKALEILNKGKAKYNTDKDILLEIVRIHLAQGDNVNAEKALSDAIASDPNNKQLHFIIGTIYTELGQNEKAEQELLRALEIDPEYLDAQYNLGAHYVTWATQLRDEANTIDPNDFKYDMALSKSQDMYKKALGPLEKYIEKKPNDVNVLLILFQINKNIGEETKATEYKKRYDAVQK